MAQQAAKGAVFLTDGKYNEAIEQYTLALKSNPESPDYYIKRSTAYQRKTPADHEAALKDAEVAIIAATNRARREQIIQAQLRRAIALFGLERYGDAEFVFGVVKQMSPEEKTLTIWENKVKNKLKVLEENDARVNCTVEKIPKVQIPVPQKEENDTGKSSAVKAAAAAKPATTVTPQPTPPSKIKHEWYQSGDKVYFTLLARGVPKDKAAIDIQAQSVRCQELDS